MNATFRQMVSDLDSVAPGVVARDRRSSKPVGWTRGRGAVLADPDRTLLSTMAPMLELVFGTSGVRTVRTNAAALELALLRPPGLLVASFDDDEIDGFGVCSAIRRHPSISHVALVMTSTCFTQSDLKRLHGLSVLRAMLRPPGDWEVRELVESLAAWC